MRLGLVISVLCAGVALHATASRGSEPGVRITGSAIVYTVVRGETLGELAARFGVYPSTIAADNDLDSRKVLEVGRLLRIDNRHIVPTTLARYQIIVNIPQRMVFYDDGDRIFAYPIAVGRMTWQTPRGPFAVIRKEENPAWHVPESIRAESASAGKVLPPVVPPGPKNPLGQFWIGLSLASIGIHGTPIESSIYKAATHGCIRLRRDEIAELYSQVALGTRGQIVYEPILMAVSGDDVYLEVHPDVYKQLSAHPRHIVRDLAVSLGLTERIEWALADRELDRRAGVARKISR
jgi:L,D-transpeptidase ErfK/SrfK